MGNRLFNRSNFGLMIIFLLYCGYIVLQSILDTDGYVTSDSAHFLQLAQSLLDGNGLTTANYVEGMSTYFATWPVGYPLLIAFVSLLTPFGVFWASKIVNMVCIGLILLIFQRLFKNRAIIVSLALFVSTFTELFVHTWSEVPFLFGTLWLVFGLSRSIQTNKPIYIIHLFLASLFLFFMRYIGLIGSGIIGLVGFYYLFRKQWKSMLIYWITGSISMLISGIYLMINKWQTGEFTGMERIPRTETALEFKEMLQEAITTEVNLFSTTSTELPWATIIVLLIGVVLFIRPRHVFALFKLKENFLVPGLFLFVGVIYFIGIVAMRWTAYFDPFNARLLGPATFMFVLFFVSWFAQTKKRDWIRWQSFLTIVLSIAFLTNVVFFTYETVTDETPTYQETVQNVTTTYEQIPPESIVAFEDFHARYLRPDIQFVKVHFRPYFRDAESFSHFVDRISPNHAAGTYLQYKSLKGYDYGQTFEQIMKEAKREDQTFTNIQDVS